MGAPLILNGINDGPDAYIIGVNGNDFFKIDYKPNSYLEYINKPISHVKSLYDYQLVKRLK